MRHLPAVISEQKNADAMAPPIRRRRHGNATVRRSITGKNRRPRRAARALCQKSTPYQCLLTHVLDEKVRSVTRLSPRTRPSGPRRCRRSPQKPADGCSTGVRWSVMEKWGVSHVFSRVPDVLLAMEGRPGRREKTAGWLRLVKRVRRHDAGWTGCGRT